MKTQALKILVIGAGGIGGITAAHMAKAGYDVEVADCLPGLAEKIQTRGLHVFGNGLYFQQKMRAYSSVEEIGEPKDIVFIATKANSLPAIERLIPSILKKDSVIVSLQNGICEEELGKLFGEEMVIGCVVGFGATVHEPGNLEMTSGGEFVIGKIGQKDPNHFNEVYEILSKVTETKTTENIFGCLFSKLIINSCITTMGAISGVTLGKMLLKRKYRRIFMGVVSEAVAVARAQGVTLEKYAGKINFYKFAENHSSLDLMKQHLILALAGFKYRKLKSSGLQSLETGRPTETDYLNGYIARKALEKYVDVPLNNFLIKLIKEIESGVRTISEENFEHPFFHEYTHLKSNKISFRFKKPISDLLGQKHDNLIFKTN